MFRKERTELPHAHRLNTNTKQTTLICSFGVPKEENFGPDAFEQYQAKKGACPRQIYIHFCEMSFVLSCMCCRSQPADSIL